LDVDVIVSSVLLLFVVPVIDTVIVLFFIELKDQPNAKIIPNMLELN
jgi:hypothetical protein